MYNWSWDWGWGWAATAGAVLLLGILLIPWFFFLLNLNGLLERVREEHRAMPPSYVWLNFIPVFCLGWFLYTVVKVRDSVRAQYDARGWRPEGDFGYNVGIAAGVLWIASVFFWWIPFIGWLLGIGWLVCWIIYWLKTSDLKKRLDEGTALRGGGPYPPYYSPPPTHGGSMPYAPPSSYGAPPRPGAQAPYGPGPGDRSPYGSPATDGSESAASDVASAGAADEGVRPRLCAACGASYDPGDRFCRSCGLPLPKPEQ